MSWKLMFPSSDFIIMKLHTYIMKNYTCFKLQATSRSIDPQGCPFPWGSVQVLFCFWIPSPQVFEQVPTYSQIVHWQSTLHCNRYRIIQLYSCYRCDKKYEKTWYSESKQSCSWSYLTSSSSWLFSGTFRLRHITTLYHLKGILQISWL